MGQMGMGMRGMGIACMGIGECKNIHSQSANWTQILYSARKVKTKKNDNSESWRTRNSSIKTCFLDLFPMTVHAYLSQLDFGLRRWQQSAFDNVIQHDGWPLASYHVYRVDQNKWHPSRTSVSSLVRCIMFRIFVFSRIIFIKWRRSSSVDVNKFCFLCEQDNVQVNTESVQCISIAYSEVRKTEISWATQQSRPEWLKWKRSNFRLYIDNVWVITIT